MAEPAETAPWDQAPAEAAPEEKPPWDQPRPDPEAMLRLGLAAPVTRQMVNSNSYVSDVARAFMSGFDEGGGNAPPLGFTAATTEFLTKNGIFQKDQIDGPKRVAQAFEESFFFPAAIVKSLQTMNALYHGAQAAGIEAGLPPDIVSMPDAFLGSPHPTGIPTVRTSTMAPAAERMIAGEAVPAAEEEIGQMGFGHSYKIMTAGKGRPMTAEEIAAAEARGATVGRPSEEAMQPAAERMIAGEAEKAAEAPPSPPTNKERRELTRYVDDQSGDPAVISNLVNRSTLGKETVVYRGHLHENPALGHQEGFVSASESREAAEGLDNETVSKIIIDPDAPALRTAEHTTNDLHYEEEEVLLGNGKWTPTGEPNTYRFSKIDEAEPAPAEMAAGKEAVPLNEARDLGVIGPKEPRLDELPPDKAAAAAVKQDKITGPEPGGGDEWQQRFEKERIPKLDTSQEIRQAIIDSAKDNNGFIQARQGDIPLSQVEALADAAGVDPKSVDQARLGRLMKNDEAMRGAIQMTLEATEQMVEAARAHKADRSTENRIALQTSIMRRDLAVEQFIGLTAEWGRTGNVIKSFNTTVTDERALTDFLKNKGRTPEDLDKIADTIAGLNSPQQVARFANDLRTPSTWDKYLFYWVNALISGPVTHLKYIGANAAFAGYEAGIVTPVAGAIGTVRRAITGGDEGVYVGEAAARLYGLLAGTPDALKAAYQAARENIQVPLPGEVAKNINPVINMKPNPIGGVAGTIIGIPSRGATGIHSFFNFLGYRAEIEAQAYRAAAKEHSPLTDEFWQKRQQLADNPAEAAMDKAIENGYHLTFISEQGKVGKAISELTRKIPALKLIIPFNHIPGNILRGALEQTPAAFLDEHMRADLTGKNGAVAQDTQIARLVAGGTISAMVANWAVNDRVTGFGPTDETDRAIWLRTHEPYSVRMGGWWVSYNKFGPIGDLFGLVANLVDVGPHVKEGEYAEAAGRVIKGASRLLEDEVGMQGLVNAIEAMEDPDRKMGRFLSSQAASNLPYSSLLRQTASFNDPYMREAKTFVDQLRYSTPFTRQELLPKIDWLGQPVANPGHQSIIRTRAVNENPIDQEIGRLGGAIKPAPPQDRIGGVKLTPELYHEYQVKAGALTNTMLSSMVRQPGWDSLPPGIRAKSIHGVIESSRKAAESLMQVTHPALIMQGYKQRLDELINAGRKPKRPPEGLQ